MARYIVIESTANGACFVDWQFDQEVAVAQAKRVAEKSTKDGASCVRVYRNECTFPNLVFETEGR